MATRTVLLATVMLLAVVLPLGGAAAQDDADTVRVIVMTIDSLHPDEVGAATPNLQGLKDSGTWYEQHRAVMAAETLPNHVAIGTGTYPGTNGIPGNDGRAEPGDTAGADPDLGQPSLLGATSTVAAIEAACPALRTVTVLSKGYVHEIFVADPADAEFDQPTYEIPVSGHAPEAATVPFILDEIRSSEQPFDYLFANLGDVDRAGHVDPTGASGVVAGGRQAALEQTDTLVGEVVRTLQDEGLWESTVLLLGSDHSMDYSNPADPTSAVDVAGALEADDRTAGQLFVSENGGAALVYLLDPSRADADEVLAAAREVLADLAGVDEALYRQPNPLDPGNDLDSVHPAWHLSGTHRAGELFVTVQDGFRVSGSPLNGNEPSNPLPGNHGHPTTAHATLMVTGGWDGLADPQSIAPSDPSAVDTVRFDDTEALPEQSEQVDVAPTVGWLLGLADPGGDTPQWEGRVLEEAFDRRPAASCLPSSVPDPSSPTPAASPTPPPPADQPSAAPVPATPVTPVTGGGLVLLAGLALAGGVVLRRR